MSEKKRVDGLCPLTPEEIALVLQALGFTKDTRIYIASGEIYGGERRLAALRAAYPNIVSITHTILMRILWYIRVVFSEVLSVFIGGLHLNICFPKIFHKI